MAEVEEVEQILGELLERFGGLDDDARAMLPSSRIIRAACPDLDLIRYARWQDGALTLLEDPPARRADIRISVRSDDLVQLVGGELTFRQAYVGGRLRVDASMADLLRLRAAL